MTDFWRTLENGCFCLDLKSGTKEGIIREMIDHLVTAGKIKDGEDAVRAVLERETWMSTGMQHGVALPHGRTAAVEQMVTVFALKKSGVDFGSLDGELCRIFVMTISPVNRTGPHARYLAEISKFLNSPEIRERLVAAGSVQDVLEILS